MSLSDKQGNLKALFCAFCQGNGIEFNHQQPDGFFYPEEDVKKHTQAFIEKLKESLMINQEEKTDIIDEINKEMFDKIDKHAEEEFGDLAK